MEYVVFFPVVLTLFTVAANHRGTKKVTSFLVVFNKNDFLAEKLMLKLRFTSPPNPDRVSSLLVS